MKTAIRYFLMLLFMSAPPVFAEEDEPVPNEPAFSQQELDRMLAPIALYPDSLLSHILMAATYPLEVVEAARWSRMHSELKGQEAVRAVEDRDWDPSVKSLVAFPQILQRMDEKLRWTEDLGNAFLAQEAQVMDTVQQLRRRAYVAGHLRSHEHYRVVDRDGVLVIESVYPDVVHVPYYNPLVVYGPWWYAGYPPVYWEPWPHYRAHAYYPAFWWSVGVVVGSHFFFTISNWHHKHLVVAHHRPFYYHKPHYVPVHHHHVQKWHHDPYHRHGVPYRHPHHKQYVRVDAPHHVNDRVHIDRRGWSPAHRGIVHHGQPHSSQQPNWHQGRSGGWSGQRQALPPNQWRAPSNPPVSAGSAAVPATPRWHGRNRQEVTRVPATPRTPGIDASAPQRMRAPSPQMAPVAPRAPNVAAQPRSPSVRTMPPVAAAPPAVSSPHAGAPANRGFHGRFGGGGNPGFQGRAPEVRHAPSVRSQSFGHSGGGRNFSQGSANFGAQRR